MPPERSIWETRTRGCVTAAKWRERCSTSASCSAARGSSGPAPFGCGAAPRPGRAMTRAPAGRGGATCPATVATPLPPTGWPGARRGAPTAPGGRAPSGCAGRPPRARRAARAEACARRVRAEAARAPERGPRARSRSRAPGWPGSRGRAAARSRARSRDAPAPSGRRRAAPGRGARRAPRGSRPSAGPRRRSGPGAGSGARPPGCRGTRAPGRCARRGRRSRSRSTRSCSRRRSPRSGASSRRSRLRRAVERVRPQPRPHHHVAEAGEVHLEPVLHVLPVRADQHPDARAAPGRAPRAPSAATRAT